MVGGLRRSVSEIGFRPESINSRTFSRSVSLNPDFLLRDRVFYGMLKNTRSMVQEFTLKYVKINSIGIDIDSPTVTADAVFELHALKDLIGDSDLQIETLRRVQLLLKRMREALPYTILQSQDDTSLAGLLQRIEQDQIESIVNYVQSNWLLYRSPAGITDHLSLPEDLMIQSQLDILSASVVIRQYFDNCMATFKS